MSKPQVGRAPHKPDAMPEGFDREGNLQTDEDGELRLDAGALLDGCWLAADRVHLRAMALAPLVCDFAAEVDRLVARVELLGCTLHKDSDWEALNEALGMPAISEVLETMSRSISRREMFADHGQGLLEARERRRLRLQAALTLISNGKPSLGNSKVADRLQEGPR